MKWVAKQRRFNARDVLAKPDRTGERGLLGDRQNGLARLDLLAPVLVVIAAGLIYGPVYFREDSVPTAIGANLVPAERILKGEVPYRDFYKIQTPGILLLNAGLFKVWGTTWRTAATGVFVFKVLTVMMAYLAGSLTGSRRRGLVCAGLVLVWLAPGGPFRPAPIQYEMLFVMTSIWLVLSWVRSRRILPLFAAGAAVGMVAIFKQNVGVYAAVALIGSIVSNLQAAPDPSTGRGPKMFAIGKPGRRALAAAALGVAVPLAALAAYLIANQAFGAAIEVFVRGPGEHIQAKFTGYPLPKEAIVVFAVLTAALVLTTRVRPASARFRESMAALTVVAAAAGALFLPQSAIDNSIYWFSPALFGFAAWEYLRFGRGGALAEDAKRGVLAVLLLFSMASYGEVFPRSVRGLVIGALPPAFLLLSFLLRTPRDTRDDGVAPGKSPWIGRRLAFVTATVVLAVVALRIDLTEYFLFSGGEGLRFKAGTQLSFDRGRGMYLPRTRAAEVEAVVDTIQSRVEEGGYFFAHALDASSYYFLSDRNSPTGATLWNDTGTNDRERVRTLAALKELDVRLVLTSEQAMSAETYSPLLDYLTSAFHPLDKTIGKTVFLERNR